MKPPRREARDRSISDDEIGDVKPGQQSGSNATNRNGESIDADESDRF